jgi:hypothetical protein
MSQGSRGLDNRHRDANGEISRKHGSAQIRSGGSTDANLHRTSALTDLALAVGGDG